jgi:hypothetical protein
MKKKVKIVIWAFLILLIAVVGCVTFVVRGAFEAMNDSYAQWDAAIAINNYMQNHYGAWPKDWTDLQTSFDTDPLFRGSGWKNMRERVEVDFAADPAVLVKTVPIDGDPPFKVVWLINGKIHHWSGKEPNILIWNHLKDREAKSQTQNTGTNAVDHFPAPR